MIEAISWFYRVEPDKVEFDAERCVYFVLDGMGYQAVTCQAADYIMDKYESYLDEMETYSCECAAYLFL